MNLSIAFSVAAELLMDSKVFTETASPKSYIVDLRQISSVVNKSVNMPSGLAIFLLYPAQMVTQVIWFFVSVPVLSEQMLFAPPIVSQDDNFLTKFWSTSIF